MRRVIARAAWLAALALPVTACGAPSGYMGVDLAAIPRTSNQAELQALAKRAQGGDKWAQYELGKRYETGDGVPVDLGLAKTMYRLAAQDSGGTIWLYSPSVGNGTSGRVISVSSGPKNRGLEVARRSLQRLQN